MERRQDSDPFHGFHALSASVMPDGLVRREKPFFTMVKQKIRTVSSADPLLAAFFEGVETHIVQPPFRGARPVVG